MKQLLAYYNIKCTAGIQHNSMGQAILEISNMILKDMLKMGKKDPHRQITQYFINFKILNANGEEMAAVRRHWIIKKTAELN